MLRGTIASLLLLVGFVLPGADTAVHAQPDGFSAAERAAVDRVLTTTRSVRKRLDLTRPVDPKLIEQAIEIAVQAPTGSNVQGWHFLVVTEPAAKAAIADLCRKGAEQYRTMPRPDYGPDDPRRKQQARIAASGAYLSQHLHEVPAIVFVAIDGRVEKDGGRAGREVRVGAARCVVLHARTARARRGSGMDHARAHPRARGRQASGHPGFGHARRHAARRLLHGLGFPPGQAPSGVRTHVLERVGS